MASAMAAAWLRFEAMTARDSRPWFLKCSKTKSTTRATSAAVVCTPSSLLDSEPVASGTYSLRSSGELPLIFTAIGKREMLES
ncbi:hypothetical protein D3C74_422260 [compost metagenome]